MKKSLTLLGLSAGISLLSFADFKVDFSKIRHWSGEGENEAALVVQFLDDFEKIGIVWGYRWRGDESPSGEDMIRRIAAESSDFCALIQLTGIYGSTLDGIGYSRDNSILNHLYYDYEGASDDPYIMFGFDSPNSMMGQNGAPGDDAKKLCESSIEEAKESHIIEHPLDFSSYGYPAYDYDWWKSDTLNAEMRWNAGWYAGYWSYWIGNKDLDSSEYSYSGLGMTSVKLKPGDVNAWKFMPLDGPVDPGDYIDGTTGATVSWADRLDYSHFSDSSVSATEEPIDRHNYLYVYDLQGRFIGVFEHGEIDLAPGAYIVKKGTKTTKFIHK